MNQSVDNQSRELPERFVARMMREKAVDGAALTAAMGDAPVTGIRLNRAKCATPPAALGTTEPVSWCGDAFYLTSRPDFTLMPELHGGGFYVQDPSSTVMQSVVADLVGTRPVRMLDVCAAPGGKSTAALAALPKGSILVANEVMPARAAVLAENIVKWGNPDVIVTSAPASKLGTLGSRFDIIAVDAPCSGEGMMRKEVVAVSQWSERLVESCAALQREILTDIIPALRPGGFLIYSTCTFSRAENEENVEWLIDNFGFESIDIGLDRFGVPAGWSQRAATYRFMPHLTRGEGLFIAVLRKEGEQTASGVRLLGKKRKNGHTQLPQWVVNQEDFAEVGNSDTIRLLRSEHVGLLADIGNVKARILHAGIELGTLKQKNIIPAHSLALSTAISPGVFPHVELPLPEALEYLNRTLSRLPQDAPKGYVTVGYNGLRLGFAKNLGNRINSLYPMNWRIRKSIE